MSSNPQQSTSTGVPQKAPLKPEEDVEFKPGGSGEPNDEPETPGAKLHHPPAE